jgi:cell division protein FtsB
MARRPKKTTRTLPRWLPYGATVVFAAVLCLSVNFRAFSELSREVEQHENLQTQIESITSENLNLQEEIYYLQNDSSVIEREARKFGFKRKENEKKVSVPTSK